MQELHPKLKYWYELGYEDQCWNNPVEDYVWGLKKNFWSRAKYPLKYQKYYRLGQINAFLEGKANKPDFYDTKTL